MRTLTDIEKEIKQLQGPHISHQGDYRVHLNLAKLGLNDEDIIWIAWLLTVYVLETKTIYHLDLQDNCIGDEGAISLSLLSNVININLKNNSIGYRGARAFIENDSIISVNFCGNGLSPACTKKLSNNNFFSTRKFILDDIKFDQNPQATETKDTKEKKDIKRIYKFSNQQIDDKKLGELTTTLDPSCEELDLTQNKITDIKCLSGLKNLKKLKLGHNEIVNIAPLAALTKLEQLDISYNKISDLTPLAGLVFLEKLSAKVNPFTIAHSLKALQRLTSLDLSGTNIDDFTFLQDLRNLRKLFLHFSRFKNLEVIANLTNLTTLNLNQTDLKNLAPISQLSHLTKLHIDSTHIRSIRPLSSLPRLTILSMHDIDGVDVSYLEDVSETTNLLYAHVDIEAEDLANTILTGKRNLIIETRAHKKHIDKIHQIFFFLFSTPLRFLIIGYLFKGYFEFPQRENKADALENQDMLFSF